MLRSPVAGARILGRSLKLALIALYCTSPSTRVQHLIINRFRWWTAECLGYTRLFCSSPSLTGGKLRGKRSSWNVSCCVLAKLTTFPAAYDDQVAARSVSLSYPASLLTIGLEKTAHAYSIITISVGKRSAPTTILLETHERKHFSVRCQGKKRSISECRLLIDFVYYVVWNTSVLLF